MTRQPSRSMVPSASIASICVENRRLGGAAIGVELIELLRERAGALPDRAW